MDALIIEDEVMARNNLMRMLSTVCPDVKVNGCLGSVREALDYLASATRQPDVIFMDVELSDGNSFEIFKRCKIESQVIMTTAYDSYAVKAFEAGSIDYLLKPIDDSALQRAVERCRRLLGVPFSQEKLMNAIENGRKRYKERFVVRFNDNIVPIRTEKIVCIFSEEKTNYMVVAGGRQYITDLSLDQISAELDPASFFRISRSCIISMGAVESIVRQGGGRLKVRSTLPSRIDTTVSRSRTDDFLKWIEGE